MQRRDSQAFFSSLSLVAAIIAVPISVLALVSDIWGIAPESAIYVVASAALVLTSVIIGAALRRNRGNVRTSHEREPSQSSAELVIVWREKDEHTRTGNLDFLRAEDIRALAALRAGTPYSLEQVSSAALIPPRRAEEILAHLVREGLVQVRRDDLSEDNLYIKQVDVEQLGEA